MFAEGAEKSLQWKTTVCVYDLLWLKTSTGMECSRHVLFYRIIRDSGVQLEGSCLSVTDNNKRELTQEKTAEKKKTPPAELKNYNSVSIGMISLPTFGFFSLN